MTISNKTQGCIRIDIDREKYKQVIIVCNSECYDFDKLVDKATAGDCSENVINGLMQEKKKLIELVALLKTENKALTEYIVDSSHHHEL